MGAFTMESREPQGAHRKARVSPEKSLRPPRLRGEWVWLLPRRAAACLSLLLLAAALAAGQQKGKARDLYLGGSAAKKAGTGPLGLRYSFLKAAGGGQFLEVDPDSSFRSGDRIRLTVEANESGYLYVILRGASGNWSVLFPSASIAGGNNRVEQGQRHEIPPNRAFTFVEPPGEEHLFIVLSRAPEPDLEQLIYSLKPPQAGPGEPGPAQPISEKPPERVLLAKNSSPIDDAVVGRLREQVLTRDLVFEKVSEEEPQKVPAAKPAKGSTAKLEKAMYVVSTAGSREARVVVDVRLRHE